jgi:uncharacterized protein YggE
MKRIFRLMIFSLLPIVGFSQDVQINRNDKTIAVTAVESITTPPEVASVKFGVHSYGQTKETAFKENLHLTDAILAALKKGGIKDANIETSEVSLDSVDPRDNWSPEMKAMRQFKAEQSWKIRVPAADAERILDLAIRAGANQAKKPEWDVLDPAGLQAKAGAAALQKARRIAEQMAEGLGVKLGGLVYASNFVPPTRWQRMFAGGLSTQTAEVTSSKPEEEQPSLKIYPEKVNSEATVHAVFATE